MKKALLFVALVISLSASAQNFPPNTGIPHQGAHLKENLRTRPEDDWVNTNRTIHHQAPEHLTTVQLNDSIYVWQWDTTLIQWTIDSKKVDIAYDANNNLTFFKSQQWDGSAWANYKQYTYTYDEYNNQTSLIVQSWDSSAWVNYEQYTYTYDEYNNELMASVFFWYGSEWFFAANISHEYTYDAYKNIICDLVKLYIFKPPVECYKYTFTYDNNNKTSEVVQILIEGIWKNVSKYTSNYDDKNNLTNELRQEWIDSVWVDHLQDIYAYDISNNQTSHIYQEVNGSTWKIVDLWNYYYDHDNFKTSESHKHFDLNDPEPVIPDRDSTRYYFHTVITAVNDVKADDGNFNVFPNPSSGKFTISSNSTISSIEIYNLFGEHVYSNSQFYQKTTNDIDLSDEVKGIYIINIYNGKLLHTRKIVVQ